MTFRPLENQAATTATDASQIFFVPVDWNHRFTGRRTELELIRIKLEDQKAKPNGMNHRLALHGLGGVGKTQLADTYARMHRSTYNTILWVDATDKESLLTSFLDIAVKLKWVSDRDAESRNTAPRIVLDQLYSSDSWLLVLDNFSDFRLGAQGYLPDTERSKGHTLITTRHYRSDQIPADGLEILPLQMDESVKLLMEGIDDAASGNEQSLRDHLEQIGDELGHLPLALAQASDYIRNARMNGRNISRYLEHYETDRGVMLSWLPPGFRHEHTVATTWRRDFDHLGIWNPGAMGLLQLFSFLNPNEIVLEFLQAGSSALPVDLIHIINREPLLRGALASLEGYSLVRVWDGGGKFTVHRLVQAVIVDQMNEDERANMKAIVIKMASLAFPDPTSDETKLLCRKFYSQATSCLDLYSEPTRFTPELVELVRRVQKYRLLEDERTDTPPGVTGIEPIVPAVEERFVDMSQIEDANPDSTNTVPEEQPPGPPELEINPAPWWKIDYRRRNHLL
jgi:NB-ARC domain